MNGLIIQISWKWALGIIGTLIVLAWKANGRFTNIETSLQWMAERLKELTIKIDEADKRSKKEA